MILSKKSGICDCDSFNHSLIKIIYFKLIINSSGFLDLGKPDLSKKFSDIFSNSFKPKVRLDAISLNSRPDKITADEQIIFSEPMDRFFMFLVK